MTRTECRTESNASVTPVDRPITQDQERLQSGDEELRALLASKAILHSAPNQQLVSRDGRSLPWMFWSWGVSLTERGSRLLARSILKRLAAFESRQLASHGYTSLPLTAACVLASDGECSALCVRDRPKAYGARRLVEGIGDRRKPVVIIDDSLSSGTSLMRAIAALEADGWFVEGTIAVVHFPGRGGAEWARARGYRVETIFDIWSDLEMPVPAYMPGWRRVPVQWESESCVPDGQHPAVAARKVATHFLNTGKALLPSKTLDIPNGEGRGGVYVSLRHRDSDFRIARDGFWHFDPDCAEATRDLVLATIKTVSGVRNLLANRSLEDLKIAVSFFSQLEETSIAGLDFDRYGIVVQSSVYPPKLGGALPNTQVFTSEIEQYNHARWTNARISLFEPHRIYRHLIHKYPDPGSYWLPYGTHDASGAERDHPNVGMLLAVRVGEILEAELRGLEPPATPISDSLIPGPLWGIAVTLYDRGLVGCSVAWDACIDTCLQRATRSALHDRRYGPRRANARAQDFAIVISILHDRECHGTLPLERAARKLRLGLDTLAVQQGKKQGIILANVPVHYNFDKKTTVGAALRKARITTGPAAWTTTQTSSWLVHSGTAALLKFGFPERSAAAIDRDWVLSRVERLSEYISRQIVPDGLPAYCYDPVADRTIFHGTAGRLIHAVAALRTAALALGRADLGSSALDALKACANRLSKVDSEPVLLIPHQRAGVMAECQLLATVCSSGDPSLLDEGTHRLATKTASLLRHDGSVTSSKHGRNSKDDHDFLPGVALLALGEHALATGDQSLLRGCKQQLNWYRRRFQLVHPWGIVGWHPQAWRAIWRSTKTTEPVDFIFEIADWAIERQCAKNGAFLTDLNPSGPSFHTAFVLEGIVDALSMANEAGDRRRFNLYLAAVRSGIGFMRQLIIEPEDTYCMPNPEQAIGGVRATRDSSLIRIDYVSHTLFALTKSLHWI